MATVDGLFDAIALIFVHIHEDHRAVVHQRLASLLRPGGMLILEAFSRKQLGNAVKVAHRNHALYFCNAEADFSELELIFSEEACKHLDEGPLHLGNTELVRLLARKPL